MKAKQNTSKVPINEIDTNNNNSIIVFNIDMQPAINQNAFIPGIDKVDVAGTFNNWIGKANLKRVGKSSIYTIQMDSLTEGAVLPFKFRINSKWSTCEFINGGANREFVVKNGTVYNTIYNERDVMISNVILKKKIKRF